MQTTRLPPQLRLGLLLATLIVALTTYGIAFWQVHAYEAGIVRHEFVLSGAVPTPVIHLIPLRREGNAIAIIVHGYSGSKELMIGFGLELAKLGVPSYLMDLPGHGASPVGLGQRAISGDSPQLETALGEVVSYARAHSDVPHPALVLLGHSLGTQVVGEFAAEQPTGALAATILVSPIIHITPTADHPANVLYLVGEQDIAGLLDIARDDMTQACGLASVNQLTQIHQTCGTTAEGTGRTLTVIPGANHITILTDAATFRAMDAWVAATDHIAAASVDSDIRLDWTILGVAFAVLAIIPLIALSATLLPVRTVTEPPTPPPPAPALPLGARFGVMAGGVALTVVFLRGWATIANALGLAGLRTPLTWMHMTLADYAGSFALVLGLTSLGLCWLLRRQVPLPPWERVLPQLGLGALVALTLYVTLGTLSTAAWERLLLDEPRFWRFLVLVMVNVPLFAAVETLFGNAMGARFWGAMVPRIGALSLILVGYVGAILLDRSLFFLSLLLPIQALLFLAFAIFAYDMRRQGNATAIATTTFMALTFAWAVAAIFPIIQ